MFNYNDIKKANDSIKTTDIKGKDYAEVNQRIKAFRMVVPNGFITTEMTSNDNGTVIFKATVGYYEDGENFILGTGYAYEKENSSFINKTSFIENCETSAVGRALGMAGFGIDTSVASADEVQNAILNQPTNEIKTTKSTERMASTAQVELIKRRAKANNLTDEKLMNEFGFTLGGEITYAQASKFISKYPR